MKPLLAFSAVPLQVCHSEIHVTVTDLLVGNVMGLLAM
jgi:hypothetical protein